MSENSQLFTKITSKQSTIFEITGKQFNIFQHNNLLDDKKKITGCGIFHNRHR